MKLVVEFAFGCGECVAREPFDLTLLKTPMEKLLARDGRPWSREVGLMVVDTVVIYIRTPLEFVNVWLRCNVL